LGCLFGVVLMMVFSLISFFMRVLIVLWFKFIWVVSLVCDSCLLWWRWVMMVFRLCWWMVFWFVFVFGWFVIEFKFNEFCGDILLLIVGYVFVFIEMFD